MYKKIREEYETTKTSFVKLGKKYNVNHNTLAKRAKREGWKKYTPPTPPPPTPPTPPPLTPSTPPPTPPLTLTPPLNIKENIVALLGSYYHEVDNLAIELYIDSYYAYIELKNTVKKEGRILTTQNKNSYINPTYTAMQMERNNLMKMSKNLGLQPIERIKKTIQIELKEDNKSVFDFVDSMLEEDLDI